eukprot:CAMPEP_0197050414 /NCGR_PEP_ID=MMETSP1384-20130603/25308_1 /TAXON_ID=29189 /ORGANISM="Ammonia sp." /LENGTH=84 /DNA_ID=CAMNT_0042482807 /DNA_START=51 /DNA_END=301 /DNA_ORIENTATION=-
MTDVNGSGDYKFWVSGFEIYGETKPIRSLYLWSIGQWRFWARVWCWRGLEVTSRIFIVTLIWQILGGVAFFIAMLLDVAFTLYA